LRIVIAFVLHAGTMNRSSILLASAIGIVAHRCAAMGSPIVRLGGLGHGDVAELNVQ
jgi:hypothetical protein